MTAAITLFALAALSGWLGDLYTRKGQTPMKLLRALWAYLKRETREILDAPLGEFWP